MNREHALGLLTEFEARQVFEEKPVVILPVGSLEQHGPHLPASTDSIIAEKISLKIAEALDGVVLPVVNYGNSFSWTQGFISTVTLSQGELSALVVDIGRQIGLKEIEYFIIFNGHGGNPPDLITGAKILKEEFPEMEILIMEWWAAGSSVISQLKESSGETHGGEFETSVMLYLAPDLVQTEKYTAEYAKNVPTMCFSDLIVKEGGDKVKRIQFYSPEVSQSGVYGDPFKASPEKGRRVVERVVENAKRVISELKGLHQNG